MADTNRPEQAIGDLTFAVDMACLVRGSRSSHPDAPLGMATRLLECHAKLNFEDAAALEIEDLSELLVWARGIVDRLAPQA